MWNAVDNASGTVPGLRILGNISADALRHQVSGGSADLEKIRFSRPPHPTAHFPELPARGYDGAESPAGYSACSYRSGHSHLGSISGRSGPVDGLLCGIDPL